MSQAAIRAILETKLATWATANGVTVQWENAILSPEPLAYVRCYLLPDDTEAPDIERAGRDYRGIFQLTLLRPLNEGAGPAEAWGASLAAAFDPAVVLTGGGLSLVLTKPLSMSPALSEPAHRSVPCTLYYRTTKY